MTGMATNTGITQTTIEPQPDQVFALQNKRMDLDAGILGRLFGTGSAAPSNIAGIAVLLLLGAGVATVFMDTKWPASEYWKIAGPIITLILGYLFGKNSSQ